MPTIPWTSSKRGRPATVVQVSRLELRRARDVPGFLVAALRIRRATLRAPGSNGLSLRAAPLSRTFWTLSSWEDRAGLSAFVRSDEHRAVMERYRDSMAGSRFHTWVVDGATEGPPSWGDALERLEGVESAGG